MKICAVYKITNTITGDFYIGSSKDVKKRWREHKCQSVWNERPNSKLYQDMKKFGTEKFVFEILAEVEENKLKKTEQQFIETLHPTYNDRNANGRDTERYKESQKKFQNSDKRKEYEKTERYKESQKKALNKYQSQLCRYNGVLLTLHALSERFSRAGIPNPTTEAKKYLI